MWLELGNHQEDVYYAVAFGKPATKTIPKSEVVEGYTVKHLPFITAHTQISIRSDQIQPPA